MSIAIYPSTIKNPLQHCTEGMSQLTGDLHLHPRTTTKPSGFQSAAARLLLRNGGKGAAANGDSIEFFSALRKCLPDPHVSGQAAGGPAKGRGKVRRGGGSSGGADELLSSEIGKHDYDWLLTPPGTPLWSPATSTSGHQVPAAVPSRLAKDGSASHGKSNSRVGPTGLEKESPTSRLSKCSSATQHSSVDVAPSGRLLRVRTSSASSINTASNASVSSTPLWPAGSSPRTPGTARSAAATAIAQAHRRYKARQATGYAAVRSKASPKYKPGPPAPTCSRAHPTPSFSSPRSTTATSRLQALARRATAVPRSRLASTTVGARSTPQAASPRAPQPPDAHVTRGVPVVASSSDGASSDGNKSRLVPAAVKQDGVVLASSTTQRWRQSLAPVIAAARSVRRENSLDNGSARNSAGRKINGEKATPHRPAAAAAVGSGLTENGPRKSVNTSNAKRTVKANEDCRRQDAKHGGAGAPAHRKPALLQDTSRSVKSRSPLGLIAATSKPGSITGGRRSTSGSGQHVATLTAAARIAGPDAFPSTRYDAMLLREDPKNLTWLRGCDEGDDGSGAGLDLVDSSLELFSVASGSG